MINEPGGVIKTAGTAFAYTGTFTNNGSYQSDPADNFFTDLVVGPSGILGGSYGDRFFVSGNFASASTKSHEWDTRHADLLFGTSPAHTISVNGIDLGPTDGYADNFAWGTLSLTAGETLSFTDGNQTPGGALYVGTLALGGGLAQLANIHGNGINLYYDPAMAGNAYLLDQTYALAGGGQLLPASAFASVPEPATIGMLCLGAVTLIRRRRRAHG